MVEVLVPILLKMMNRDFRKVALFYIWLAVVSGGFARLFVYANTPGALGEPGLSFPNNSIYRLDSQAPTLFVFAHPRCPCTKATIGELERLVAASKGRLHALVIFVKPKNKNEDWSRSELWELAERIPGVRVYIDEDGLEAAKFHAFTSGQTYLFSADGKLVFNGGITPGRGHMGDNLGYESVLNFLKTGKTELHKTRVFGCSLMKPERKTVGAQSL